MEITYLENNCLKFKCKKTSFIIDPTEDIIKTNADAVLLTVREKPLLSKVTDYRIVISGPGEYEVGGIKISGINAGKEVVYSFKLNGADLVLGSAESIANIAEKAKEHHIAIIKVNSELSQSVITTIEPRLAVLYGLKSEESAKLLKSSEESSLKPVQKITITEDKLPEEMQVAVLG